LSEKERFTRDALNRAGKLSQQMHESYKKGLIQQSTERIFFAENKKLTLELNGIQGDRARALAELSRKSGMSLKDRTLQSLKFKPLPAEATMVSLDTLPLVERTRLRSELAVAQEKLARLDAYPDFAPRLAFEHTSDGDNRINLGISLELPFSERNQAERLRHSATKLVRESEASYINDGHLKNEIDLLLQSLITAEKQVDSFKSDVIPAITSALTAAELELNAGQGTNLLVWQLLKELNSAQDRYLELWIKALAERVELSVLTGDSF
jgi:outer membrane protein TolC